MSDASAGLASIGGQNSAISIEEFMRIFVDQLKYQDPLNPVDNKEFISQIAQFTSLQLEQENLTQTRQLNDTLDWLNANHLIGRRIEARVGEAYLSGVVERIRVQDSGLVADIRNAEGEMFTGISMGEVTSLGADSDAD